MDRFSFKSQGAFKHARKSSGGSSDDVTIKIDGDPAATHVSFAPATEIEEKSAASDDEGKEHHRPPPHAGAGDGDPEVLKCTSSTFQRRASMLRLKTKSRLEDTFVEELEPPKPDKNPKTGILGPLTGLKGRSPDGDDDEDPSLDDDFPEEYTKSSFDFITLLQWLSLILLVVALVSSFTIPSLGKKFLWRLNLWKWEFLILIIICGRLLSGGIVNIIIFLIERNFLFRRKFLYFVYGLKRPVQNCIWLSMLLLVWQLFFRKALEGEKENKYLKYVNRILVCLLLSVVLWMLKTLMIKAMTSSFHVKAYFDRIQEALYNQYVIEALSGPPLVDLKKAVEDNPRLTKSPHLASTKLRSDSGIDIASLNKMSPENVSAWNMKRLMKIVRHGVLSTLDEEIQESSREDESANQIRTEREAKAAARKIFLNVARRGNKYIYLVDLMRFMQEEEAIKTMSLFEGSEFQMFTRTALKNWLVNAFRDRRALALTLSDTRTAVKKLHNVVNVMVFVVIMVLWIIILRITTSKLVMVGTSHLLVVAFIFGNTLKTIFEAIIFLFVMHPYDVGDRCEIDGIQMVVEEMNILTTIFLRWDNQKIMYLNSVLATKSIGNYYRSPDMAEEIEFCIHIGTPIEKIALAKQRIISYMENKKEHWDPHSLFVVKDVDQLNMIRFVLWPNQTINFQNAVERWNRRGLLVEEMARIFREYDIQYRLLPVDINITAMPNPTTSRVPQAWLTASG